MLLLAKWEVETNILEHQHSMARARALPVSRRDNQNLPRSGCAPKWESSRQQMSQVGQQSSEGAPMLTIAQLTKISA